MIRTSITFLRFLRYLLRHIQVLDIKSIFISCSFFLKFLRLTVFDKIYKLIFDHQAYMNKNKIRPAILIVDPSSNFFRNPSSNC
jgi:hypothetical protein